MSRKIVVRDIHNKSKLIQKIDNIEVIFKLQTTLKYDNNEKRM